MADIYLEVEDYLWFVEYQQGNVNVAGLVFDDLIEETLDLGPEEVLTVYSDVVEETLDLADDPRYVGGQHWTVVSDSIAFAELFGGAPIRVKQSILNVVYTKPVMPIKIAHMHLDVVMSGSDTFMEEVSDELMLLSSYANAVPYWWELIQESFSIDMTEPQPNAPLYLKLSFVNNDLFIPTDSVVQDYLFNSQCFEELFVWDGIVWGWDKLVAEALINTDIVQEIIGKIADDYLYFADEMIPRWLGLHLINDTVFAFDDSDAERYYLLLADETFAITDGEVSCLTAVDPINETLGISETVSPQTVFTGLATESLVFTDISTFVHDLIIQEGLALGDVELTRWVFNVLIESGCDTVDIIA